MNNMKWFRVYSEIKDDPKILELDDHQRWLWICLLAMASESTDRGTLTSVRMRGLAAALRTDEVRLSDCIQALSDLDMIEYDATARTIEICHWNDRQYDRPSDIPSATRDRKRKSRSSHADVTTSHAIEEIRGDTEENRQDTDTERDTRLPPLSATLPADDILFDALAEIAPKTVPFRRAFSSQKQADRWHQVADVLGDAEVQRCVDWCIVNDRLTIGKIISSAETWHNNNRKAQAAPGRNVPNGRAVPNGLPSPEMVWGVVQAEIDRVHYSGTPNLPAPILAAVEAVGGWYTVCKSDPAGAIPARLRDAYRSALGAA